MSTTIVFSAAHGAKNRRYLVQCRVRDIMLSFHYWSEGIRAVRDFYTKQKYKFNIWIDSGAFSIWDKGGRPGERQFVNTTREKYAKCAIDFYNTYRDDFENIFFVSFDKIPGYKGIDPTADQIGEAYQESWDNFQWLREQGVPNLLPVVHHHEPVELITEYENVMGPDAYICLSPANDHGTDGRRPWLDAAFATKLPTTKAHGLAVTSDELIMSYNWHSVDSATWLHNFLRSYGKTMELGKPVALGNKSDLTKIAHLNKLGLQKLLMCAKDVDQTAIRSVQYFKELEFTASEYWGNKTKEIFQDG